MWCSGAQHPVKETTIVNYYETVVVDYLRADRALFVNTEYCIQLNRADNPDTSGPHWYCDAVVADFQSKCIFLVEISYSAQLSELTKRLKAWNENWPGVSHALARDSFLPHDWPVRPWTFVPEKLIPLLLKRLEQIASGAALSFVPRITPLEMVQPWQYRSWNRVGEARKPTSIPPVMQS
jgi:hypothetical protein